MVGPAAGKTISITCRFSKINSGVYQTDGRTRVGAPLRALNSFACGRVIKIYKKAVLSQR